MSDSLEMTDFFCLGKILSPDIDKIHIADLVGERRGRQSSFIGTDADTGMNGFSKSCVILNGFHIIRNLGSLQCFSGFRSGFTGIVRQQSASVKNGYHFNYLSVQNQ